MGPQLAGFYRGRPPSRDRAANAGSSRVGYFMQVPFLWLNDTSSDPDSIARGVAWNDQVSAWLWKNTRRPRLKFLRRRPPARPTAPGSRSHGRLRELPHEHHRSARLRVRRLRRRGDSASRTTVSRSTRRGPIRWARHTIVRGSQGSHGDPGGRRGGQRLLRKEAEGYALSATSSTETNRCSRDLASVSRELNR